jgi:hypothetical protein
MCYGSIEKKNVSQRMLLDKKFVEFGDTMILSYGVAAVFMKPNRRVPERLKTVSVILFLY